jgi:PAS domain-containing protein
VPYTYTTAPELEFSFIGESCKKVTGFPPEQFTGKASSWINHIHPYDKKKVISAYANISKNGSCEQPFRWKCAHGKYREFINYIRYTAEEAGKPAGVAGIWQAK